MRDLWVRDSAWGVKSEDSRWQIFTLIAANLIELVRKTQVEVVAEIKG